MKILCASRNFFPEGVIGGAQASLSHFAKAFVAEGHEVAVLSVDDHAHEGAHVDTGLAEYRLKLRNLYLRGEHGLAARTVWHAVDRFGNLMEDAYGAVIDRFRPDVIFTHVLAGLSLAIWKAAQARGIPVVHMVHDYYPMCVKSGMRRGAHNCRSVCGLCRVAALRPALAAQSAVSSVIYVSDHMRTTYRKAGLFHAAPSYVIHGSYEPAAPVPARTGLVDGPTLTLGYFGRLAPEKGVPEMLRALRALRDVDWRLRVGGSGNVSYEATLRAEAADLPVTFLGVQPPDAFYAAIDVLIVPSLWNDPAPRVVYEAGIHQAIPVVSNVGGLPQLVAHGQRGFVIDLDDPAALGHVLRRIAANPAIIDAQRAQWRTAAASFSHGAVSAAIGNVLASVARGPAIGLVVRSAPRAPTDVDESEAPPDREADAAAHLPAGAAMTLAARKMGAPPGIPEKLAVMDPLP